MTRWDIDDDAEDPGDDINNFPTARFDAARYSTRNKITNEQRRNHPALPQRN